MSAAAGSLCECGSSGRNWPIVCWSTGGKWPGTLSRVLLLTRIGLLAPSRRSAAGHRLYTVDDVAHLYRIGALRRLGFPLDQVAQVLNDPQWELRAAVERHLELTRRRAQAAPRLLAPVTGMTVVAVDDADTHHARSVAAGAVIVEAPMDQPYGVREYGARDPEGQLWYFH